YTALRQKQPVLTGLPAKVRNLPVFQDPSKLVPADPQQQLTCNSNTHFAIMAMWAARRYDVPIERTLKWITRRFSRSQNPDGSWGYRFKEGGGEGGSPALTCAGLLGLAVGQSVGQEGGLKKTAARTTGYAQAAGAVGFPSLPAVVAAANSAKL